MRPPTQSGVELGKSHGVLQVRQQIIGIHLVVRRQHPAQRAEVGVGVDSDYSVAAQMRHQRAEECRDGGLAHAALGRNDRNSDASPQTRTDNGRLQLLAVA